MTETVLSLYPSHHAHFARIKQSGLPAKQTKLSILMPVFNEERTVAAAVSEVLRTSYPCEYELIIVNDGSRDGTNEILSALRHSHARVIRHPRNLGKGAALQTGAFAATGTHVVPFDADMEYEPSDLVRLIEPVLRGRCDVVYGVRLPGSNTHYQSYRHVMGNRALTFAANVMFDAALSDIHTCLKLLPTELFRELDLSEDGFGLDSELTAKLLARGIAPFEVPVSYHSRSTELGKKITWRDGFECLYVLAKVRSARRTPRPATAIPSADPLEALEASIQALEGLREPLKLAEDGVVVRRVVERRAHAG